MCSYNYLQACNQTLLERGSKPDMVTQINSKWGPLFVRSAFSMYNSLLDLCYLSLSTCEMKLPLLLYTYSHSYI